MLMLCRIHHQKWTETANQRIPGFLTQPANDAFDPNGAFAIEVGMVGYTTGPPVCAIPEHRRTFVLWQILGMIDLVTAVSLGTLAHVIDPQGIPTNAMTVLPLSLIPTFAVPLLLILHILCLVQARRWKMEQTSTLGKQLRSQPA